TPSLNDFHTTSLHNSKRFPTSFSAMAAPNPNMIFDIAVAKQVWNGGGTEMETLLQALPLPRGYAAERWVVPDGAAVLVLSGVFSSGRDGGLTPHATVARIFGASRAVAMAAV